MSDANKTPNAPPQATPVKVVDIVIPFESLSRLVMAIVLAILATAVTIGGVVLMVLLLLRAIGSAA